jgi:hypothetical protein
MGLLEALGWVVTALVAVGSPDAQRSPGPDTADGDWAAPIREEQRKSTAEPAQPSAQGDETPWIDAAAPAPEAQRTAPVAPAARSNAPTVITTTSEPDLGGRANELSACHPDIAGARPDQRSAVPPGSVLLRWTVLADGGVRDTEVVPLGDTDPAVLDCIKRKMTGWTFARRPETGPVHLEHELKPGVLR